MNIAKAIDEMLGASETEEKFDKDTAEFVEQLHEALSGLENVDDFRFKNVIRSGETCGFARSGRIQYLVNTDRKASYKVTVRTYWRSGINSGQYDRVHKVSAGSRKNLGCTVSGSIPTTSSSRSVVGEERV